MAQWVYFALVRLVWFGLVDIKSLSVFTLVRSGCDRDSCCFLLTKSSKHRTLWQFKVRGTNLERLSSSSLLRVSASSAWILSNTVPVGCKQASLPSHCQSVWLFVVSIICVFLPFHFFSTWRANAVGACTFGTDWKMRARSNHLFFSSKQKICVRWLFPLSVIRFMSDHVTVHIVTLWTVGFLNVTSSLVWSWGANAVTLEGKACVDRVFGQIQSFQNNHQGFVDSEAGICCLCGRTFQSN